MTDDDVYGVQRGVVREACLGAPLSISVDDEGMQHTFWTGRHMWNNAGDTAGLYNTEGVLLDRVIAEPTEVEGEDSEVKQGCRAFRPDPVT